MNTIELIGTILSLIVIYYNSQIIRFGLKNIDPTEHIYLMRKIALPASLTELAYFFWAFKFLPTRIIMLLFIATITTLLFKLKKITGYKFAMFVLAPITESAIVLYGLYTAMI